MYFNNRAIVNFHRSWCETCKGLSSPSCQQKKHKITDFIAEDVEEHDTLVVQVESGAQEALDKRNKGEEPLVIERDQLKAKLDTVVAQIEENQVAKGKLCVVIANCKEMKKLDPASKVAVSMRKNLEKKLKEVKEEIQLADQFLKRTNPAAVGQPQVFTALFFPFIDILSELIDNYVSF